VLHALLFLPALERVAQALEPPGVDRDDVEADIERRTLRVRGEPRVRRPPHASLLFGADCPDRAAERIRGSSLLYLDEPQHAPASDDEVELVPAGPDVRAEDAPSTKPVPPRGAALAAIQRRTRAR
jgi:hypothetical protein